MIHHLRPCRDNYVCLIHFMPLRTPVLFLFVRVSLLLFPSLTRRLILLLIDTRTWR